MSIVFIVLIIILILALFPSYTPQIKDSKGKVVEHSVALLEKVEIGGIEQFLMVRGENKNNPVILFIHGGPGVSDVPYIRKYQKDLEKEFVVVEWEQRGTGKSYKNNIPTGSMNIAQFISDTKEVTDYLCNKFNQNKIFIVGHSWGTVIGTLTAQKYHDKYYAYIGIGQVVNSKEGNKITYNYILDESHSRNNEKAIKELEKIGQPPYKNISDTNIRTKWLKEFGGYQKNINSSNDFILGILFSPEYTWVDGYNTFKGLDFSLRLLIEPMQNVNLIKDVPEFKIPVYFCVGRYDYTTPYELVEKYYNQINAPKKELIWFENSAHFPNFEEPEKFAEVMKKIKEQLLKN